MEFALTVDARKLAGGYRTATPFPHVVIDDLFPERILDGILNSFPAPYAKGWALFDNEKEKKLGNFERLLDISPSITQFLYAMSSPTVLGFLETVTGIEGLIPDPYFAGGGLHQIERGGFLKVHADFNWHPKLRLDRRLNVLVYLNKGWREEYGGRLELWDHRTNRAVVSVLPTFNRTVIFSTTDSSYHGHPEPLRCPAEITRKSLSFYYYSNGRPDEEHSAPHDTIFR